MSDTYNPLEAGLIGAIDFHKGCYIGQEVIARLDTYQKVQKYLVSLSFDADPAQAGALTGSRLVNDEGAAMGLVTSTTVVPTAEGEHIIGLGYVRTAAVQIGGTLRVANDEGDTGITARITAQPLLFGGEKPGPGQ
jgi:folate-binding protein YgfZ